MNLRLASDDDRARIERRKQAQARVAEPEVSAEEWAKIFATKLSDTERDRLRQIKAEFDAGRMRRLAEDKYTKIGRPKAFSKAEALRRWPELVERRRQETLRRMVEDTPENYKLVLSEQQLRDVVESAFNENIIAVDTETTGLDVYTDVIVGVSLTLPTQDIHYYIPFKPTTDERALPIEHLEILRPLIESRSVKKIFHNAIFDIAMFKRHGINLNGLAWDTMTAMHLLNENEPKGGYKLKKLAPKYLKVESDTFDELFGEDAKFSEIPLDIALVYAAKDTHLTYRLYKFQRYHMSKMPEMLRYYETVEVPLLPVIVELEANGYILDLDFAKEYGEKLRKEAEQLHKELVAELSPYYDGDGELNLNSPQQLRPTLSKAIGRELPNLDAKKTLKPLRKEFPIIEKLLEYKRITKLSSTYIDSLPQKQNPTTKRWHSRFNPMGTVTGRFSSGKDEEAGNDNQFNVQNQPYEARKMFIAPPGKVIIGADFKAQEVRCVAYLSGEQVLIDAFNNGKDPYAWVASMYYKRPYHEVYKNPDGSDTKERKLFKTVVLAYIYGTSKWGLAEQLGTTPDDAEKLMKDLSSELPRLAEWVKEVQDFAAKHGYVWMDGKQRKRRLPDAKLKARWGDKETWRKINRAKRQAPNACVQGTSSIQTKVTMINAAEMCREKGNGWSLWGTVHDELLFEAPVYLTRKDIADIERVMTQSYRFGDVPNGTDIEIMRRWGEGMSVDEYFNGPSAVQREKFKTEAEYLERVEFVKQNWQGA